MWNYGWPIGPGINILNIWLTLRASHKSARLAFGPKFMSRLVRLARSPCRLGPSYRKSVNLKNVSFSAFFKVRASGRSGQNSSYNEPVYVGARKVWFASQTKLSSAAARWITGNRGNRRNFWLEKFGSLREPNF